MIFACHLPRDKFCQKNLSDPDVASIPIQTKSESKGQSKESRGRGWGWGNDGGGALFLTFYYYRVKNIISYYSTNNCNTVQIWPYCSQYLSSIHYIIYCDISSL